MSVQIIANSCSIVWWLRYMDIGEVQELGEGICAKLVAAACTNLKA